jgi:hypothetical protein
MSPLQDFLSEHTHRVPGARITFAELYAAFIKWASPEEGYQYTKHRFSRELREYFVVGRYGARVTYVANCSMQPASAMPYSWTAYNGRLVKRRTKPRGNLCLEQLLPILNRLRDKSPERIAATLNAKGKRTWRGNTFHPKHIKRLLEAAI